MSPLRPVINIIMCQREQAARACRFIYAEDLDKVKVWTPGGMKLEEWVDQVDKEIQVLSKTNLVHRVFMTAGLQREFRLAKVRDADKESWLRIAHTVVDVSVDHQSVQIDTLSSILNRLGYDS